MVNCVARALLRGKMYANVQKWSNISLCDLLYEKIGA